MFRKVTEPMKEVCGRLIAGRVPTLVLVAVTVIATGLTMSGPVSAAGQIPTPIEAVLDGGAVQNGDKVIALFAVFSDGTIKEWYAANTKRNKATSPVTAVIDFAIPTVGLLPDQPQWMQVYVANPKICWTTSSGDQVCIVY